MKKLPVLLVAILCVSFLFTGCNNPKSVGKKYGKIECQIEELGDELSDIQEDRMEILEDNDYDEDKLSKGDRKDLEKLMLKGLKLQTKISKLEMKKDRLEAKQWKVFKDEDKYEDWLEEFDEAVEDAEDDCD